MKTAVRVLAMIAFAVILPFYAVFRMLACIIPGSRARAMQRAIDYIAKTGVDGFTMIEVIEHTMIDPAYIYIAIQEWLQQNLLSKYEVERLDGSFQIRYIRKSNFQRKPNRKNSFKNLADILVPKPIPQG